MVSFSDKLRALGVEIGTQNLPKKNHRPVQHAVQHVVPGEELTTRFGPIYVVSEHNSTQANYGNTRLSFPTLPQVLADYCDSAHLHLSPPTDLFFIDTETTGLGLGSGTFAFLIGIGKFNQNDFQVDQYFLRDPSEEAAALVALAEQLPERPIVVSFNGKAFDIPLLNNRYILNGITSPFHKVIHLDLLHLARRLWRERLPSRTLINLEGQILFAQRTQEDVPGWVIPQLYNDYLNTGDARLIKNVFYHNAKDVLAMAALLNYVSDMLTGPVERLDVPVLDMSSIGVLYQSLGYDQQACAIFRTVLEHDLPDDLFQATHYRLAMLLKSMENWEDAILHWKQAAEKGNIDSCVELAKFYEHKVKNFHEALAWTDSALEKLSTLQDTIEWQEPLDHRRGRLTRRLAQNEQ
jgi:uncharacterized protein YprB with RNaseH-like and TPR domain